MKNSLGAGYLVINILFVSSFFIGYFIISLPSFLISLLLSYHILFISFLHIILFVGILIYELIIAFKRDYESAPLYILILLGVAILLNIISSLMFWG